MGVLVIYRPGAFTANRPKSKIHVLLKALITRQGLSVMSMSAIPELADYNSINRQTITSSHELQLSSHSLITNGTNRHCSLASALCL